MTDDGQDPDLWNSIPRPPEEVGAPTPPAAPSHLVTPDRPQPSVASANPRWLVLAGAFVVVVVAVALMLFRRDGDGDMAERSDGREEVVATGLLGADSELAPSTSAASQTSETAASVVVVPRSDDPPTSAVAGSDRPESEDTEVTTPVTSTASAERAATSTTISGTTTIAPPSTTSTVPPTVPTTVFGDLAVPSLPMSRPECNDTFITMVGSAVVPGQYQRVVSEILALYPGAQYLRTDQTCSSLRPNIDGDPIYSIYFGPYPTRTEACDNRLRGPADAYVRILSNTVDQSTEIKCD